MEDFKAGDFVKLTENGESMISASFEELGVNYKIGASYKVKRKYGTVAEIYINNEYIAATHVPFSELVKDSSAGKVKDELINGCNAYFRSIHADFKGCVGEFVGMHGTKAVISARKEFSSAEFVAIYPSQLTTINPFSKENKAKEARVLRIAKELYKIGDSAFDFDLDWEHSSDYCKERYIKMVNLGVRVKGIK